MDGALRSAVMRPLVSAGASVALRNVEKRYQNVGAVRGISLDIESGEFVTLLGPSGSGKTTTLMMAAGFETPDAGDIEIDGRSVVALPPHKRGIGMVFQNYALFPHLTVAENIAFPLRQRGVDKATRARLVSESLDLVRLPGHEARYPRQLSGGQQQRVALARAVVFRPRLLLMDEPLGALDKQLRESMQLEMRRLHGELGITFIYVTHDQEEALTMSDRIAVMNEGLIAQIGTPEDLYDRPRDRFVASFIGESNFLPGTACGTENGLLAVNFSGTVLFAGGTAPKPEGESVTLTVRPERVRFASGSDNPGGTDGSNRVRATISESVFAGERRRYVCACDGGVTMILKEPSSAATRRRDTGERVELTWSAADTSTV
jgi:spermidine/putrescine ABC transporter ATP-binding subunit